MKTIKVVVKGDKVVSVSASVLFFALKKDPNKYVYAVPIIRTQHTGTILNKLN
jgi:hypothetical protein